MTSWPGTIPHPLVGLEDETSDDVLRTPMEAGPQKYRRRFTVARRTLPCELVVTGTQRAALTTLYETTLAMVDPVDLEDPATGNVESWRFASRPVYVLIAGHDDDTKRVWRARFSLEFVP